MYLTLGCVNVFAEPCVPLSKGEKLPRAGRKAVVCQYVRKKMAFCPARAQFQFRLTEKRKITEFKE